jgi:hypothetical protein
MRSFVVVVLLALATTGSVGCAGMGTKRPAGGQPIQLTAAPASPLDNGSPLEGRPELGQR